jgi:hypothetical protein
MKKLIVLFLCLAFASSAFAVDYVGVNSGSKRGKFSKTSNPVFASVTTTTFNYTVTGDLRTTNLYATTNVTALGTVSGATLNAGTDIISPTAYLTTVLSTLTNTTRVISEKPLTFGGQCPTSAMTVSGVASFNYSIPVTINGGLYKIPLIK